MKRRFYLFFFLIPIIGKTYAQEIVPLSQNQVIQRYLFEQSQHLPKALRDLQPVLEKSDCPALNPDEIYATIGDTVITTIQIDTVGLGRDTGSYSCVNCANAEFGFASVNGNELRYTAKPDIEGGKEDITVQFCNVNGCHTRTYRFVAKRANKPHFEREITIGPDSSLLVLANASLLPGRKAVCSSLADCPDTYEGDHQKVNLVADFPTRVVYRSDLYAGVDTVCLVMCDTFAVCDTFKFAFVIRQDSVTIPFMDDFSYSGPYPDITHWLDRDVFVNYDMAQEPPSIGVATFDGLDTDGKAYGGGYGLSDRLTSKYLKLKGVNGDIYLTYWLEKRGYGDRPETQDSMILEFKDKSGKWILQRSFPGSPVNEPNTTASSFQFYSNKVPNEFKYNGFQFRFRNYSERTGLLDVWHLDYVRMDVDKADSIIADIAFTQQPNFILKNYSSMPWWQFKGNEAKELRDDLSVSVWNHDKQSLTSNPSNVDLFETRTNKTVFDVSLLNGSDIDIPNGETINRTYKLEGDPSGFPNILDNYMNQMSSADFDGYDRLNFRLKYLLSNTSQIDAPGYEAIGANNSVNRYTVFDNYFAYDDGTAEAGLIAQSGVQVAVQFTTNVEDSLRAIEFHFPHTTINVSDQEFDLLVWVGELKAVPDYDKVLLKPIYTDVVFNTDTLQGFTTYVLTDVNGNPKPLYLPKGNFYVGWQQESSCDGTKCIPVGYDRNTPNGLQYMYRNLGQQWEPFPTGFPAGALMIRPVVGSVTPLPTTPVQEVTKPDLNFAIFPNPARFLLNVMPLHGSYGDFSFSIINAMGQNISNGTLSAQLDVSSYPAGLYFLKIADRATHQIWNEKFIIVK